MKLVRKIVVHFSLIGNEKKHTLQSTEECARLLSELFKVNIFFVEEIRLKQVFSAKSGKGIDKQMYYIYSLPKIFDKTI